MARTWLRFRFPLASARPRHPHENFYWLQEDYLRAKQAGKNWNFTILRPQIVIGAAIGGNLSLIPPIGVYAALLREEGNPLCFPGGDPSVFELVDTDLLARSMEWAATSEACRNETFNITNGDVATWQDLWPVVADALGMEAGPPKPLSLAEEMPKRQADWAAIVKKYNLVAPADLHAYVGESFHFADSCFAYHRAGRPMLVSRPMLRKHDQGAPGGFPRLYRFGRYAAQMVSRVPAASPAAAAQVDARLSALRLRFPRFCRTPRPTSGRCRPDS